MEPWYPYVIGSVAFFYIQCFNKNAKMYLDSGKTMTWYDLIQL
jgi:hypothetical protein